MRRREQDRAPDCCPYSTLLLYVILPIGAAGKEQQDYTFMKETENLVYKNLTAEIQQRVLIMLDCRKPLESWDVASKYRQYGKISVIGIIWSKRNGEPSDGPQSEEKRCSILPRFEVTHAKRADLRDHRHD